MMSCRFALAATVATSLAATLASCGSRGREPATHQVEIRGMQYVPSELVVAVGDTVVWTNADVVPHTVTSAIGSVAAFDSQQLEAKQQWQYKVTTAGSHAYICTFHPTMRGTLTAR